MSEFVSVVRAKVKPGKREEVMKRIKLFHLPEGCSNYTTIDTGGDTFCSFMIWDNQDALVAARPAMIENLDQIRELLEELSPELGVTDPVSGPVAHQDLRA